MKNIETGQFYREKGYFLPFETLLKKFAYMWKSTILEIEKQKKRLELESKGSFLEISYEEFCVSPKKHLHNIAKYLNLNSNRF